MRFRDRCIRRHEVERPHRPQIDDLAFDAFVVRQPLGDRERDLQHAAVGDDRHVAAVARDTRLAEGHGEVGIIGNFALHAVKRLVFEEHHRVFLANCGLEEALRIGRGRRNHHAQARAVHEISFETLAVLRAQLMA